MSLLLCNHWQLFSSFLTHLSARDFSLAAKSSDFCIVFEARHRGTLGGLAMQYNGHCVISIQFHSVIEHVHPKPGALTD